MSVYLNVPATSPVSVDLGAACAVQQMRECPSGVLSAQTTSLSNSPADPRPAEGFVQEKRRLPECISDRSAGPDFRLREPHVRPQSCSCAFFQVEGIVANHYCVEFGKRRRKHAAGAYCRCSACRQVSVCARHWSVPGIVSSFVCHSAWHIQGSQNARRIQPIRCCVYICVYMYIALSLYVFLTPQIYIHIYIYL